MGKIDDYISNAIEEALELAKAGDCADIYDLAQGMPRLRREGTIYVSLPPLIA